LGGGGVATGEGGEGEQGGGGGNGESIHGGVLFRGPVVSSASAAPMGKRGYWRFWRGQG
jgi:hypothetical protein